MFSKEIRKKYSKLPDIHSTPIEGPHELVEQKTKKFDKSGNCIETIIIDIEQNKTIMKRRDSFNIQKSEMDISKITTYKYDKRNNVIENEFKNIPLLTSSKSEYVNKYDNNRNLISYDEIVTTNGLGFGLKIENYSGKCDFNYDNQNSMIKSKKILINENTPYHFEELTIITYDNEGNINDKTIKTTSSRKGTTSSNDFYKYSEMKHTFYFDDSGQRVEEIDKYYKFKENEEVRLDYKQFINEDQLLQLDRNKKEYSYKELFYYDNKSRLIKKECFYPSKSQNEPLVIYKYEYIESVDS
jgi:hypothetical protein